MTSYYFSSIIPAQLTFFRCFNDTVHLLNYKTWQLHLNIVYYLLQLEARITSLVKWRSLSGMNTSYLVDVSSSSIQFSEVGYINSCQHKGLDFFHLFVVFIKIINWHCVLFYVFFIYDKVCVSRFPKWWLCCKIL